MFHNNRETLIKSVMFNPRMPQSGSIFEISPFFYPQFNLFRSPMKGDTEKVHFTAEPELHHIIIANVYLCHPLDNWIYRWAGSLCSLWHLTVTTCVMWPCDAMECSLSSFPLLSSPPQCWVILVRVCVLGRLQEGCFAGIWLHLSKHGSSRKWILSRRPWGIRVRTAKSD